MSYKDYLVKKFLETIPTDEAIHSMGFDSRDEFIKTNTAFIQMLDDCGVLGGQFNINVFLFFIEKCAGILAGYVEIKIPLEEQEAAKVDMIRRISKEIAFAFNAQLIVNKIEPKDFGAGEPEPKKGGGNETLH